MERKNTLLLTVIAVATLLVAVVGATFAYFTAAASGTSQANVTATTEQRTAMTLSSSDNVSIYVPASKMQQGDGQYGLAAESTDSEDATLSLSVTPGTTSNSVCTLKIYYTNAQTIGKDGATSADGYVPSGSCNDTTKGYDYASCTGKYTDGDTEKDRAWVSNVSDKKEFALLLAATQSENAGTISYGNALNDPSSGTATAYEANLTDTTFSSDGNSIQTITWTVSKMTTPAAQTLTVNVKARYYNVNADQNSNAGKTVKGIVSMTATCAQAS